MDVHRTIGLLIWVNACLWHTNVLINNTIHKNLGETGSYMAENTFALTFDDGPHESRTLKILNDLDKYNVKATFFVVGNMAKGREWLVREEIARGHDVGCHSMTHPLMTKLNEIKWKWEIDECIREVEKITGKKIELFRFPYGESTIKMEEYIKSKGIRVIYWDIDSLDWKKKPKEELAHIKKEIDKQKKGILLMHDIQGSTVETLPKILDYLKEKDAKLVQLIKNCNNSFCEFDYPGPHKIRNQENE